MKRPRNKETLRGFIFKKGVIGEMKRKLFAALLLTAALALAACGKTEQPAVESTASVSENTSPAAESAEESTEEVVVETSVSGNGTAEGTAEEMFDYSVVPAFASEDLDGNAVTNDLIAGKDITMINVWGTFCPPCIAEMPDLGKLAESLPDNAQLVGFVCDVTYQNPGDAKAAISIMENAGASFTNVILDESLLRFCGQFQFVPTTIFVDSEGNVLGDPVIGADFDSYIVRLEELLNGWKYAG